MPMLVAGKGGTRTLPDDGKLTLFMVEEPVWTEDAKAPKCEKCERVFSFTLRRHHCRASGRVLCGSCCPHRLPILRMGYVDPVRVSTDKEAWVTAGNQLMERHLPLLLQSSSGGGAAAKGNTAVISAAGTTTTATTTGNTTGVGGGVISALAAASTTISPVEGGRGGGGGGGGGAVAAYSASSFLTFRVRTSDGIDAQLSISLTKAQSTLTFLDEGGAARLELPIESVIGVVKREAKAQVGVELLAMTGLRILCTGEAKAIKAFRRAVAACVAALHPDGKQRSASEQ
eukprot:UC1_evm1s391